MTELTRRSLLVAGTGTLAFLAGCSGGDDESPSETTTPSTTEQPTTLEIENPVLCAESPTGYREYTEQPNQTYEPGDVIWVYFEPSTVGTESAGEGEVEFQFNFTISVTGPDGADLGTIEDSAGRTVSASADLSKVFLYANYSPSIEFEAGTHSLEIEVTDAIADNTASESIEFEVESPLEYTDGEFGISNFVFTESEASDYQEYEENQDAEYAPDETVWYYFEIDGFAYEETDDGLVHDLSITETLTGPEGDVWSEETLPLANEFDPSYDLDTYYIDYQFSPVDGWLTGEYEIHYEVTDGYTDETVTSTYIFTVVE